MRNSEMNSRERFLSGIQGRPVDRVPCVPDISNMIPCRRTGLPFWDIYLEGKIPLWLAYKKAVEFYGIDGWFQYSRLDFSYAAPPRSRETRRERRGDRIVVSSQIDTPAGLLEEATTYFLADSPARTEKPIKDIGGQFPHWKALYPEPTGYDALHCAEQKREIGPDQAFGTTIDYPGFQNWFDVIDGGIEALAVEYYDDPARLDEIREVQEKSILRQVEMIIDSRLFDYLLLGGSGSITLASPELFDRYAFPTIRKICELCAQAGLPTMLHSCGKELHVLERCAMETRLNCINPLEEAPMGDISLDEAKRRFGGRISLMGNLSTTDTMLLGTAKDVTAAAERAIRAAGEGGGFILSTGDQCGRDTPDTNIFALVDTAKRFA